MLKAAEQGEARAQNHFGVIYAKGSDVEKDFKVAYMWLSLASIQGNRKAKKNLDLLTEKMTPEHISAGRQMAQEWKPKT